MATLDGDTIEELLWIEGVDFVRWDEDGVGVLKMFFYEREIVLTDFWFENLSWFVDTDYLTLSWADDNGDLGIAAYEIETEADLVAAILDLGGAI